MTRATWRRRLVALVWGLDPLWVASWICAWFLHSSGWENFFFQFCLLRPCCNSWYSLSGCTFHFVIYLALLLPSDVFSYSRLSDWVCERWHALWWTNVCQCVSFQAQGSLERVKKQVTLINGHDKISTLLHCTNLRKEITSALCKSSMYLFPISVYISKTPHNRNNNQKGISCFHNAKKTLHNSKTRIIGRKCRQGNYRLKLSGDHCIHAAVLRKVQSCEAFRILAVVLECFHSSGHWFLGRARL